MKQVVVKVTQQDIDKALVEKREYDNDPEYPYPVDMTCPIAQALTRQGMLDVRVSGQTAKARFEGESYYHITTLTPRARDFVRRFDSDEHVYPATFRLTFF